MSVVKLQPIHEYPNTSQVSAPAVVLGEDGYLQVMNGVQFKRYEGRGETMVTTVCEGRDGYYRAFDLTKKGT